jgi:hypothetical protein
VGVVFNDSTKLVMLANGKWVLPALNFDILHLIWWLHIFTPLSLNLFLQHLTFKCLCITMYCKICLQSTAKDLLPSLWH